MFIQFIPSFYATITSMCLSLDLLGIRYTDFHVICYILSNKMTRKCTIIIKLLSSKPQLEKDRL